MKKTLIALMALAGVAMAGETYWSFEGTTTSAGDNAYVGQITSTVTMVNTSVTTGDVLGDGSTTNLGYGMSFVDGSYIQATDSAALSGMLTTGSKKVGDFTILSYVNFSEIVTNGEEKGYFYFGTGETNRGGIALGLRVADGAAKVDFLVKGVKHYEWATTISVNEWNHLAFSYDYGADAVTLYVNGESMGTKDIDNDTFYNLGEGNNQMAAGDGDIYIGAGSIHGGQDDFVGSVAHLQIITGQALGADAVKQYASNIIPEPATATLSLLALCGLASRRRRK